MFRCTRGGTKVKPSIFFSENVNAITMKFTWMLHYIFCNHKAIFPQIFFIFNTVFSVLNKTLCTSIVKLIPCLDFGAHHENFVSFHCHLQNGVHVLQPLQAQTVGSQRAPAVGCEQDGEERSVPFLRLPHLCASWCEAGHCREGEGRLSCFG
jgi:hypothetical protein